MISQQVTLQQGGHMTMAYLSGKGHGKNFIDFIDFDYVKTAPFELAVKN